MALSPSALRAHIASRIEAIDAQPAFVWLDQPEENERARARQFQVLWETAPYLPDDSPLTCGWRAAEFRLVVFRAITPRGSDDTAADDARLIRNQLTLGNINHADILEISTDFQGFEESARAVWSVPVTFVEG